MINDTIQSFYNTNFELTYENGLSANDVNSMIPWEREVLTFQIMKRLQERKQEAEQ